MLYQIKQYLENLLNINPQFWYIYQDIDNPLLNYYSNIVQNINNLYICHYILNYTGSSTRIYSLIFDISENSILDDILVFSAEDLSNIQDEESNNIIQTLFYVADNKLKSQDLYYLLDVNQNILLFEN